MSKQLNIFTIYIAQDKNIMLDLLRDLKPQRKNIRIWNDNPVIPNQQWKFKEESHLDQTDIFLFFISDAFMHSAFINQIEFKWIIDHYKANTTKVIPVLLDDCPWDTEFLSEDYKFSFAELEVLPEGRKPIKNWEAPDQGYASVVAGIQNILGLFVENSNPEEPIGTIEEEVTTVKTEEQIAINFDEVAAAKKVAEEQERKAAVADAQRKAAAEKRNLELAAVKTGAEKEKRLAEEIEAKRIAQHEDRLKQQAEARRIADEKKRLESEVEAVKSDEEERRRNEEQKRRQAAKPAIAKQTVDEHKARLEAKAAEGIDITTEGAKMGINKKVLIASVVAVVALFAMLIFINNDKTVEQPEPMVLKPQETAKKEVLLKDTVSVDNLKTDAEPKVVSLPKLGIGDQLEGGMIFSLDNAGKTGKIVHLDDAGPMSWQDAIQIQERLGAGWRLPSLEELQRIRKTLGQGADNDAEFTNGLYWSATEYDEYQARLLRFRDGNTSYHYNRNVESRKFLVRAVKDFTQ